MDSILEAIGNTPLIRLRRCAPENRAELSLKLELRNPSEPAKDETGDAEGVNKSATVRESPEGRD
jgi:cysteine synthase